MNTAHAVPQSSREVAPATSEATRRAHAPRVDIREAADAFHITADLPGVTQDGVEVTVEKDVLTIVGARAAEPPAGYRHVYGALPATEYRRAFTLGEEVDRDGIQAVLKHGILQLKLPKAATVRPRRIAITAA